MVSRIMDMIYAKLKLCIIVRPELCGVVVKTPDWGSEGPGFESRVRLCIGKVGVYSMRLWLSVIRGREAFLLTKA